MKKALRMRPSRLVVGEVRQEECLYLLIALNSGLPEFTGVQYLGQLPSVCVLDRSNRHRCPGCTRTQHLQHGRRPSGARHCAAAATVG
ncbi:hypothetical protein [Modestobacter sp. Leaf380]|uniref:hypothetical protein n=1 Tax=Modestobacter sp. Leaf380 TaxID=1736356 RepID=UPI00351022BA